MWDLDQLTGRFYCFELTADDAESPDFVPRCITDEEQMRSTSLKVV